jgi:hypothetical protein
MGHGGLNPDKPGPLMAREACSDAATGRGKGVIGAVRCGLDELDHLEEVQVSFL